MEGRVGMEFFIYIIAFFVTIPIIFTFIIYLSFLKIIKHSPKKALHKAVNWSTLFYIIAVIILVQILFDISATGLILILILAILTIVIFFQWKRHTDIQFMKAVKILWKICFLLFLTLYVCFMGIGIIIQIIK